jgi:hypothetical protein
LAERSSGNARNPELIRALTTPKCGGYPHSIWRIVRRFRTVGDRNFGELSFDERATIRVVENDSGFEPDEYKAP